MYSNKIVMYLNKIWHHVWPKPEQESLINPDNVFKPYFDALDMLFPDNPHPDDEKLYKVCRQLFDSESDRRTSIDNRAGVLMPATGIIVALVAGIGLAILKEYQSLSYQTIISIMATYIMSLLYMFATIYRILKIHGSVSRYTLGPDDVVPSAVSSNGNRQISVLERHVARKLLWYTIKNYKINNRQMASLVAAQNSLRNSIIVLVVGSIAAVFFVF